MPLGAARIAFLAKSQVTAIAEVIRKQQGISAVNGAQIDTAQYNFGGASGYFDRSSAYYLSVENDNNTLDPGSGDFTYECWFRADTLPGSGTYHFIYDARTTGTGTQISFGLTNQRLFFYTAGGFRINGTTVLSTATWYHLALVKSGSTTTLYLDGSSEGTYSDSNTYTARSDVRIGANFNAANGHDGHIDEFRISDSARYTTSFTPSTTPFVNDDNTKLLLHMDGTDASTTFVDDNGTGRSRVGISAEGAVVETAQSKFGGSSAYFAGAEDYLNIADGIDLGNSNATWTFECWFRLDSIQNDQYIWHNKGVIWITGPSRATQPNEVIIGTAATEGSGSLSFYATFTSVTWATGTWYHLAVTHDSGTTEVYVDGVSKGTASTNSWMFTGDTNAVIGKHKTASNLDWDGYIDEVRVSDSVRYTAGFTPSTAPFVNDDNTKLLLHMDGTDGSTDFADDNGKGRSRVGVSGTGSISTSQSKFGGASAFIDDSTSEYIATDNTATQFSTDDFTVEFWIYRTEDFEFDILADHRDTATDNAVAIVYSSASNYVYLYINGSQRNTSSSDIPVNTWTHIAVVRSSGDIKLYVNGTAEGTTYTNSNNFSTTNGWYFGKNRTSGTSPTTAYYDEIRVSNTARYTAGFTPSTTPFQNDANTLLLLHMDGTDGSTTFVDDNGVY